MVGCRLRSVGRRLTVVKQGVCKHLGPAAIRFFELCLTTITRYICNHLTIIKFIYLINNLSLWIKQIENVIIISML